MNLEEFETQYRNQLDIALNQLQSAVLLMAQLEVRLSSVAQDLQNFSLTLSEYIAQQRAE